LLKDWTQSGYDAGAKPAGSGTTIKSDCAVVAASSFVFPSSTTGGAAVPKFFPSMKRFAPVLSAAALVICG
jgi:hypothetical protein